MCKRRPRGMLQALLVAGQLVCWAAADGVMRLCVAVCACVQAADVALDAHIHQMTSCIKAMTEAAANKPHFYVTDEDIISLPCFK